MVEPVAVIRDVEGERSIGSLTSGGSPAKYQHDHSMEIDDSDDPDFASLVLTSSMVAAIDATSSRAPHGLSSPSLQLAKEPTSITPPARPSSTPFPHFEMRSNSNFVASGSDDNEHIRFSANLPHRTMTQSLPATYFGHLPTEVHETILDHIFGYCVSVTSRSTMKISSLTRGWSSALRHSRRKELTSLALVNRTWRVLVQQRLFRHIKLKATTDSIENAFIFLARSPHLASCVKHIEVWFPVFQPTYGPVATSNSLALPTVTLEGLTNATYTLPANNCTLEDVFQFVALALPRSQVLTLEGGERRKAPKVVHVCQEANSGTPADDDAGQLHTLHSVRTLVTKGQWNLMRNETDFLTIMNALPNLEEWQGSYSKAKSKSYISASGFLPLLPNHVTNLYLCMENDYRREGVMPAFYYKVIRKTHICSSLAQILPSLEHFAYTGRMCHFVFDEAMRLADPLASRLKSVDITVKNCCRESYSFHESGSGIQDMAFIRSFEKLVVSAVQSMEKFKKLEYLRIRFVDLDSILPPLNPYFLMQNGFCYGIWSELLIAEIKRVRPATKYLELSESFGSIIDSKDGRITFTPEYQRTRLASLKLSNYRSLATTITIP